MPPPPWRRRAHSEPWMFFSFELRLRSRSPTSPSSLWQSCFTHSRHRQRPRHWRGSALFWGRFRAWSAPASVCSSFRIDRELKSKGFQTARLKACQFLHRGKLLFRLRVNVQGVLGVIRLQLQYFVELFFRAVCIALCVLNSSQQVVHIGTV